MSKDLSQAKTIGLITVLLFGLLGLPLVMQKLYKVSAVEVSFVVIVIYFLINWGITYREQTK